MTHRYDDIIGLPRPVSNNHAPMPMTERAAQFSPFAALTGYGDAVAETARLTQERIELDESRKLQIGAVLSRAQERIREQPEAVLVYFLQDALKEGGSYVTVLGRIRKIDPLSQTLSLADGTKIPMADLVELGLTGEHDPE